MSARLTISHPAISSTIYQWQPENPKKPIPKHPLLSIQRSTKSAAGTLPNVATLATIADNNGDFNDSRNYNNLIGVLNF